MKRILTILGITIPTLTFASFGSIADISNFIISLVNSIVEVLITFIVVVFLYAMVKVIWLSDGENSKTENYRLIRYSIISLFVVVSLWGILKLAQNTFL